MNASSETVQFVPLSDLLDFASQVKAMRKAQQAYFEARNKGVTGHTLSLLLRAAKDHERRLDKLAADHLRREAVPLPGFADEGGES